MIYRTRVYEGAWENFSFSSRTMEEHWNAAYSDMKRTLAYPEVLERPKSTDGVSPSISNANPANGPWNTKGTTPMARFDKQVGIITGAASGIGKEIALRYAAEGGTPVIADLNLDAAAATADEIKGKGGDAFAVAMNVVDEAAVNKGVADVMAKYGRIDLLVSNAGIQIVHPLVDFPFADWKKLLSIRRGIVYMGSVHSKEASRPRRPTSPPSTG